MKQVKVVIGANYGDEGKGLMTDYFCGQFSGDRDVLNIRFNGGAQAGHTVVTSDGRRHVFSHFGSGSFQSNVSTYLSSFFLVNPILFRQEHERIRELGLNPRVYVDKACAVTLPQDMMLNQFAEKGRGSGNHGSCGLGIFETVCRNQEKPLRVDKMCDKLELEKYRASYLNTYLPKRIATLGTGQWGDNERDLLQSDGIWERYLEDLEFLLAHSNLVDESILDKYTYQVFEGAQGLLLDQGNIEDYPHLTPSNTGIKNVCALLEKATEPYQAEICYVSRSYLTRHGAGPFPTEGRREDINPTLRDRTNVPNEFQGTLRYGFFDERRFSDTLERDIKFGNESLHGELHMSLCFTHLNETGEKLACRSGGVNVQKLKLPYISRIYGSDGETRRTVKQI